MGRLGRPSNDNEANRTYAEHGGTGTDWGHGQGPGVCSMAAGVVTAVRWDADYGWVITVDHGGLIDGKQTETDYCHLKAGSPLVEVGDTVKRGEDLAEMGDTGRYAKRADGKPNVHLHSQLRLDGKRVDEQPYQREVVAAPVQPPELKPTQRKVKSTGAVNRRTGPGKNYPETGEDLKPNTVGNFDAWQYGPIDDDGTSGVWLRGISGNWFAALGFDDQGTHDLLDLNPPPVKVEPTPEPAPPVLEPDPVPIPLPEVPVSDPGSTPVPPVEPPSPPINVPTADTVTPQPTLRWWQIVIAIAILAGGTIWSILAGGK